ncbi:9534_t:CDS:2, partial [Racocetra persica]
WFLAICLALTVYSFCLMISKKSEIDKWLIILISIVNVAMFLNEIITYFQLITSSNCSEAQILNPDSKCKNSDAVSFTRCSDKSSVEWFYGLNVELREHKYAIPNCAIILLRLLELIAWFIISILNQVNCQGSYCGDKCEFIQASYFTND